MTGQTISHYKLLDKLGEGGMGVVYKAEDTKLHRTVALKFIRPDAVENAELKARFLNEAEAAAALTHPNICVVHEIDEADERSFIAMEYVEGESLAAKIKKRPLPLEEALDIAAQVAEGLQAAHEKGIAHRDIKPANIMLDAAGRAKIMDFGLAHLEEATRITQTGTSVGTPAYMSPEQVRGEKTGHRTDIWSLGVVLYEMVSGRLPFPGDVAEAISHAVLYENPEPLTALRTGVPIELDWIVGKCLAKEPGQRYQHADELRVDLKRMHGKLKSGSATVVTTPLPTPTPAPERRRRSLAVPVLAALLALSLAALLALWLRSLAPEIPVRRFAYGPAPDIADPVISPDGRHVAYTAGNRLWILDLQTGEPRVIEDTDGAFRPFWTPNGEAIAFASSRLGTEIRQVSLAGGRPRRLCEKPATAFLGGSFTPTGDALVYGRFGGRLHVCESASAINEASSSGKLGDVEEHVRGHAPGFLPEEGGRPALLLFDAETDENRILVRDLDSGKTITVGTGAFPVYCSNGYILYQTSQSEPGIWALPFSLASLEATGAAFSIADRGVGPSVAGDGTLLFLDAGPPRPRQLVWRDRTGSTLKAIGQPQQDIHWVALSPEEDRVAVTGLQGGNRDIWIHEIERRVKTRLTTDLRPDVKPVWSPAGDEIAFTSGGSFRVATTPSSEPRALLGSDAGRVADWSADGKKILLSLHGELFYVELGDEGQELELVRVLPFWARDARFSPDGCYISYSTRESGEWEVYVCEFPGGGIRTQVSTEGGTYAKWGRNGRELFYVDDGMLVAVPVITTPSFQVTGAAEKLFPVEEQGGYTYDVSADGRRFVVAEPVGEAPPPVIRVVQNWAAEFEER